MRSLTLILLLIVSTVSEAQDFHNRNESLEEKDSERRLLVQKAHAGDAAACMRLFMHFNVWGQNQDMGRYWLIQAAMLNDAGAQFNLAIVLRQKSPDGSNARFYDLQESSFWMRKAAEQKVIFAMFELGRDYLTGTGVEKSEDEAIKWLGLASRIGDSMSMVELVRLYEHRSESADQAVSQEYVWSRVLQDVSSAGGADAEYSSAHVAKLKPKLSTKQLEASERLANERVAEIKRHTGAISRPNP